MLVARTIEELKTALSQFRAHHESLGFVPTMGYLHEGHASLVNAARAACKRVVVSIFVNPTQFGPNEDLASYPRDFKRDCAMLEALGVDVVFHPDPAQFYPVDFCSWVQVTELTKNLCAKTRPTHFRGVCTVLTKLFNIVRPDRAYFGEKDAQQLAVVRRMVKDLNFDIDIVGCPIVREADGLAKSSRNQYLTKTERQAALVLSRALNKAKQACIEGMMQTSEVLALIREEIASEPLARLDYVEAVDPNTMAPKATLDEPVLFAIAVYIGKTRLIDNFCFSR